MATTLQPTQQLSPDVALRRATGSTGSKAFTIVVYAWTLIRVIPIWNDMEQGGINPELFLMISLIGAAPYCFAWPRFLDALRYSGPRTVALWFSVIITAFAAPYTYFIAAGRDVPIFAWAMIIAFIAMGIASIAKSIITTTREVNTEVTS